MKIDRLIAIIMVLLNNDKISAAKLAEKFEVTTRTIYRDVDAIALAGIPIVTYPGVNGGIGLMPEYKVDKHFFTRSEISNLLTGLGSLSTALSDKEIAGTLEKVKNMLPENQAGKVEMKAGQITIDLTTWMQNRQFKPNFDLIKKALDQNKYLVFGYRKPDGAENRRRIEPHQLILKEGHWYLYGFCSLRDDFRVFKLGRMSDLGMLNETFTPRKFQAKKLDGTGWIDTRLTTIQLSVHISLRERMVELCGADKITSCDTFSDKGRLMVEFPFTEDDYGYNFLLGLGDKCECLGPEHVRKELIHRIKKLKNIYSGEINP